ncbi:FMN-dependent NADH-azoreductase [Dyadobacter chenhuakuii]|uniref:FMN dependent NADH:quinone oxidoreductase n=1 Tax=Dyadobacter chenhuakuii TaxID=2909339 RepID=A0A9X1QI74_9BACT|nr:NAD(P)H-dependent oxidoreductase [Dyadobacter chenhuakuii]MCF2501314.1 NAD(P)H-dependent oxidoreductase [Dyadobacter chenhuakuii]
MKKLLVINSSPRAAGSHSRKLTEVFADTWREAYPDSPITFRDLASSNIPHVSETWISAAFKPESQRNDDELEALKISTELICELKAADVIVIGAPMYNWSITSSLKAYIDQVLRMDETWALNRENRLDPYIGLLKNKTVFLLFSRGAEGYEPGEYNDKINFQAPYLRRVFNVIGITDIREVALNGAMFERDAHAISARNAAAEIRILIAAEFLL